MKKKCSKCGIEKDVEEFNKSGSSKDGHSNRCRKCQSLLWKDYYNRNREKLLEKDRLRFIINPEKEKARHKKYRERLDVKRHKREWYREYSKERLKNDSLYSFKMWVRRETRRAAVSKSFNIHPKLEPILGCTAKEFQKYLHKTWKINYNEDWNGQTFEIDHITPLSSATNIEDIIKLCHYSNVQMLTPEDNSLKGKRIISIVKNNKV